MISEIFWAVLFEAAPMFFANYFCFFQVRLRNNFFRSCFKFCYFVRKDFVFVFHGFIAIYIM